MNSNQSETKFSIRMNPRSQWFELIVIENSVWINPNLGLNRIRPDRFLSFLIKRVTKRFSDWFRMIRISSDTDIGMNPNSSGWLGMNSYPILSPGKALIHQLIYFHWYNQWLFHWFRFIEFFWLSYTCEISSCLISSRTFIS